MLQLHPPYISLQLHHILPGGGGGGGGVASGRTDSGGLVVESRSGHA